jgi:cytochrome oxidase Cu insertion factor (SCO1/SenC/PrrC family)
MKRTILCLLLLTSCSRKPDLPVMNTVPQFTLIERSSREVKNQELAGQIWIADFIYTTCGGICPIMTGKMKKLQEKLPKEIRLVSFSVDPEVDTPAVLSEYANKFGADPQRWLFLTGNRESLFTLSKDGFKLAVEEDNGTELEPITHSSRFVLVDRQGRIRGYYSMDDPSELEHIVSDAKSLL